MREVALWVQTVEDSRIPELQARQRNIVEAWQQSLAHMFPQIKVTNPASPLSFQHTAWLESASLHLQDPRESMTDPAQSGNYLDHQQIHLIWGCRTGAVLVRPIIVLL